jgi:hypothetical protein
MKLYLNVNIFNSLFTSHLITNPVGNKSSENESINSTEFLIKSPVKHPMKIYIKNLYKEYVNI